MFLRYFIELPLPAQAVEQALLASPATWLPRLADRAGTRGEELLTEVGIGPLSAACASAYRWNSARWSVTPQGPRWR